MLACLAILANFFGLVSEYRIWSQPDLNVLSQ